MNTRDRSISTMIPFVLELLFVFLLFNTSPTLSESNSTNEYTEIIMAVNSATNSNVNNPPEDFKFDINIIISSYFQNPCNYSVKLEIPEGVVKHSVGSSSISNLSISDNLGSNLQTTIQNNTVVNEYAEVVLPPNFNHKITLSFLTDYGVFYQSSTGDYNVALLAEKSAKPTSFCLRLPKNYTVIPIYLGEPTIEEDDQFIILKWSASTNVNYGARFVPFLLNCTINSYKVVNDISTVFPIKGQVRSTIEKTLVTPTKVGAFNFETLLVGHIPFPLQKAVQNLLVEGVWDGLGQCSEVSIPFEKINNDSRGHYYVDHLHQEVIVYPRYSYKGDFCQFSEGATFVLPASSANQEQVLPFRYKTNFTVESPSESTNWKFDITGNVEIKFILPVDAAPIVSENDNASIGVENNRPTVSFIYNSPGTLSSNYWPITYDIIPLRNYFILAVISIAVLIATIILIVKLPYNNIQSGLGLIGVSAIMIWNIKDFIGLGGLEITLTVMFVLSLAFWFASMGVALRKRANVPATGQNNQNNSPEPETKTNKKC